MIKCQSRWQWKIRPTGHGDDNSRMKMHDKHNSICGCVLAHFQVKVESWLVRNAKNTTVLWEREVFMKQRIKKWWRKHVLPAWGDPSPAACPWTWRRCRPSGREKKPQTVMFYPSTTSGAKTNSKLKSRESDYQRYPKKEKMTKLCHTNANKYWFK